MTDEELDGLERLEREAFRAPWTYSNWEVECPCDGGSEYDCSNKECDGSHVPCTTIESPDEYPDGQIVAQFQVPGLSCLADRNGALIVALRNAAPALISAARRSAHLERAADILRVISDGIKAGDVQLFFARPQDGEAFDEWLTADKVTP